MAAQAKFILSAQDNTKTPIQSAISNLAGLDKAALSLANNFKGLATGTGLAIAAKQVGQFTASCYKDFGDAERVAIKLQETLGNGQAYGRASALVDTLAKSYVGAKDDVEKLVSSLAAMGKSGDGLDSMATAAINLSNAFDEDASTSMNKLVDLANGKLSPMLARKVPELNNLTEAELKSAKAIDIINSKLGDMTDALANGNAQKVVNLSNSFADLKETLGDSTAPFFAPFIDWLNSIITKTNDAIAAQTALSRAIKAGANASLEQQLTIKNAQLNKLESGRRNDLASQGLGDFKTWLNNLKIENPSYNKSGEAAYKDFITAQQKALSNNPDNQTELNEISILKSEIKILSDKIAANSLATDKATQAANAQADAAIAASHRENIGNQITEYITQQDEYRNLQNAGLSGDSLNAQMVREFGKETPMKLDDATVKELWKGFKDGNKDLTNLLNMYLKSAYPDEGERPDTATPAPSTPSTGTNIAGLIGQGTGGLGNMMSGLVGKIGGIAGAIIGAIMQVMENIKSFKMIMDPMKITIQGITKVLEPVVNEILSPMIGTMQLLGTVIGKTITPLLMILAPILKFITYAFLWLYNYGMVPFCNGVLKITETIANFFVYIMNGVISALNHIPFVNIKKIHNLDLSSAKLENMSYDDMVEQGNTAIGTDDSSSTTGSNATYSGSNTINVNIYYNNSYVNGDRREIAIDLYNEIQLAQGLA